MPKVQDVPNQKGKLEVLRCNLSFDATINGNGNKTGRTIDLIFNRVSPSAFSAIAEDEEVKKRCEEVIINLQDRARASLIELITVEEILLEGKI